MRTDTKQLGSGDMSLKTAMMITPMVIRTDLCTEHDVCKRVTQVELHM